MLSTVLIVLALVGLYVFNQNYKITPRTAGEGKKSFSIAEFLKQPVCYLDVIKSDVPTENGFLEDISFIELTYIDTDNVTGPYYSFPVQKDSKVGIISSYSIETVYPDNESYLIKAFYEYDAEGEKHIKEQFFMLINGEIRIASGELKLEDDGKTYVYAEPQSIKWTDAYLRSDCKTARKIAMAKLP